MNSADLYHKVATRSATLEIINASVMVVVAASFVIWAIVDAQAAKSWWWPYALIELVLAMWNLLTYRHRDIQKCKGERRGRG